MKNLKDFGAWVALIGMVVAACVAYGGMAAAVHDHTSRFEKLEPTVQQHDRDIATLKQLASDTKDALDDIKEAVGARRKAK